MKVNFFNRSRLFSLLISTLLIFTFFATPCEVSAASGGKKTVYVVSSVNVSISGGTYYPSESFTGTLKYNKNGLLTNYSCNASDKLRELNACYRNCSFTYKGKKLIKERYGKSSSDLSYTTKYKYKKGALKGYEFIYSKDDFFSYKCKLNKKGRITRTTNLFGEKDIYNYDSNGYLIQSYPEERPDLADTYSYDAQGNLTEAIVKHLASPIDSSIVADRNSAVNTYSSGRLTGTVIAKYDGSKVNVTVTYTKKKVPKKYYKAVKTQQHDIIARYVHGEIDSIPLGSFKK